LFSVADAKVQPFCGARGLEAGMYDVGAYAGFLAGLFGLGYPVSWLTCGFGISLLGGFVGWCAGSLMDFPEVDIVWINLM
jgi:hypothetical protein